MARHTRIFPAIDKNIKSDKNIPGKKNEQKYVVS